MKLSYCFLVTTFLLAGCNPFSLIDQPSGDAQILSAARACFDKGDFTCATRYYGQLSSSSGGTAASEIMLEELAQAGITSSVFISSILNGDGQGGKIVTALANSLASTANETNRLAIFHAYQKNTGISNSRTRGLMKFIASLSLLSEILAEDIGTTGILSKADIVVDPDLCPTSVDPFLAECQKPPGKLLTDGTLISSLAAATDLELSGTPTLHMINVTIQEITSSLSEMQGSGGLSSSAGSFSNGILNDAGALAIGTPSGSPLYRKILIQYEIGADL